MTRTHVRAGVRARHAMLMAGSLAAAMAVAPAASAEPLPLRICSIDDRSGSAADTGIESLNGLKMVIDPLNEGGGINGRKVELIEYDGKTDAQLTATLATRCAEDDEGLMIIGPNPTAPAAAVVPVANQNKIPAYILSAAANALTDNAEFQFRFGPKAVQDAIAVSDALAERGFKRVAIINNSLPFGIDGSESVMAALKEKGIEVVGRETYDVAATDVTPQVMNLSTAKPDVVLVYSYPADGARVIRSLRQMGISAPLIMPRVGSMKAFRDLAAADADGVLVPTSVDITRPEVKTFFEDYAVRYGAVAPTPYAVQGYDAATLAVKVLSDAEVQKAIDSGDLAAARLAIRDATLRLGRIDGLQGMAGVPYQFGPGQHHGTPDTGFFVYTEVAGGGKELVAPDEARFRPAE